jgi:serine kinase of HPr protein (carbohydrate metabolism regulator)
MMEIRQASDADLAALVTVLGQRRLAIGVGLDNPNARRLYERLGVEDLSQEVAGEWHADRHARHRAPGPGEHHRHGWQLLSP